MADLLVDSKINPYLKKWESACPNLEAGKGEIEVPGATPNIIWQTRDHEPTPYENALADALEEVFEAGALELCEVVKGLNDLGFRSSNGEIWSEDSFTQEMHVLAG